MKALHFGLRDHYYFVNAMEGSRIWIDLSAVCTGALKQSCIYLDYEKCQNVKDVEDHIRRVFGIDNPVNIFNEGWLLPSSESSRLLRDNDTVRY